LARLAKGDLPRAVGHLFIPLRWLGAADHDRRLWLS
jgi:hypothetical protein